MSRVGGDSNTPQAWDYGIASIILTNAIGESHPEWPWALKSLPPTLFALVLACSIPSFEDLVGILTGARRREPKQNVDAAAPPKTRRRAGVTIVSSATYAVTLPWALGDYEEDDATARGWLHVATAVGVPLSAYIVAASLYFATTIPYSSDFFCSG